MVTLHPSILEREGKKAFAVIPYEEFVLIQSELQDYEDLKELRAAKAKEAKTKGILLREARRRLGV